MFIKITSRVSGIQGLVNTDKILSVTAEEEYCVLELVDDYEPIVVTQSFDQVAELMGVS